ncbi:hypothetical protein QVD99_004760 [Batrachochytrium dendrobatidis]|nr:hypothetical protein QVD99_004760 [Batrachochytrium dendrobatidis]
MAQFRKRVAFYRNQFLSDIHGSFQGLVSSSRFFEHQQFVTAANSDISIYCDSRKYRLNSCNSADSNSTIQFIETEIPPLYINAQTPFHSDANTHALPPSRAVAQVESITPAIEASIVSSLPIHQTLQNTDTIVNVENVNHISTNLALDIVPEFQPVPPSLGTIAGQSECIAHEPAIIDLVCQTNAIEPVPEVDSSLMVLPTTDKTQSRDSLMLVSIMLRA